MDFELSDLSRDYITRMQLFMDEHVYPSEKVYAAQRQELIASGSPNQLPPVVEDLKRVARAQGLWNLFLPSSTDPAHGLSVLDYAPIAEISGRSVEIAPEAINCSAPDTGNMELLEMFATPAQRAKWLEPLLAGELRSAFAMTEPDVASSDATNIAMTIERAGNEYVINGRKWWTTGVCDPRCGLIIVMGKTSPKAEVHNQQSMVLVPMNTPGLRVVRPLPVFGYWDQHGHGELEFVDVRVPVENLLGEEGAGFALAQARLGPGRVHHCMRAIGMAERAFDLMVERADTRVAFGKKLADQGVVQEQIALSRIEIDQARLLILKTAWLIEKLGAKGARSEIAAIKVVAPRVAVAVIDRAIQIFGGAGVSDDWPLAQMYAMARTLRLADGPDEVHLRDVARQELKKKN